MEIKALAFDVFGTVVDWRGTIIKEGTALGRTKRLQVDWARFADAWRAGYQPMLDRVRQGELPWTPLDRLHRLILEQLLIDFRITTLTAAEIDQLNQVWHRLLPWPDVIEGLTRLRTRYILATLSNGNIALLVNMAKQAHLPWDCILSAELAQRYKPDPEVYLTAARLLDLRPQQIMMVAAHPADLQAAQAVGMRTAFIPRPLEYGQYEPMSDQTSAFDVVEADFNDLAERLGVPYPLPA
ncbi:MAG: haloacid dehalogenase type II [Chloroflexi bacterium]|nr:haloacid dehalogenase type II [Chloroflexota bacterium]